MIDGERLAGTTAQADPPSGNGLLDQVDMIASLTTGNYLTGPYTAIAAGGMTGDNRTSITCDPSTGAVGVAGLLGFFAIKQGESLKGQVYTDATKPGLRAR